MIDKIHYEPVFRKILWLLVSLCLVYVLRPIHAVPPVTAAFVLLYLLLFRPKIVLTPLVYGVSFFIFWLLVSILANQQQSIGRLSTWLWLFEYYLIFCGCLILLRSAADLGKLVRSFTMMTLVFACFGYLELLFTPQLDFLFRFLRSSGTLHLYSGDHLRAMGTQAAVNPAFAGLIYMLGAFFCFAFALESLKKSHYWLVVWWMILTMAEQILVFFTFERAPVLIMALGGGCQLISWVILNPSHRKKVLALSLGSALVIAGAILLSPAVHTLQRFQTTTLFQTSENSPAADLSTHGRLMLTYLGWRIMVEHPVFGIGLENFQAVVQNTPQYYELYPEVLPGHFDENVTSSHNVFTHFGSESGFPGALAMLFILGRCVFIIFKFMRAKQPNRELSTVLICLVGLGTLLIAMIPFDFSLTNKAEGMTYFLNWALFSAFEALLSASHAPDFE